MVFLFFGPCQKNVHCLYIMRIFIIFRSWNFDNFCFLCSVYRKKYIFYSKHLKKETAKWASRPMGGSPWTPNTMNDQGKAEKFARSTSPGERHRSMACSSWGKPTSYWGPKEKWTGPIGQPGVEPKRTNCWRVLDQSAGYRPTHKPVHTLSALGSAHLLPPLFNLQKMVH